MMEMMCGAMEHILWWLSPVQTKDKRSGRALLQFAHIGTMVVIQHGGDARRYRAGNHTLTRSTSANVVTIPTLLCEKDRRKGLFKAVPPTADTFMVFESTGNGNTGWWAE